MMDIKNLLWRFRRKLIFAGVLSFVLYLFYIESCPDNDAPERTHLQRMDDIVLYNRRISDLRFNETFGDLGWGELKERQEKKRKYSKIDDAESQLSIDSSMNNDTRLKMTGYTRRTPQAIIIGVKKCGTRALLEYLRLHPKVVAPGPEIHYFDKSYDKGIEWYRDQMPKSRSDQLTIEKSPSYFITKEVPKRIYDFSPNIKLLLSVRNPIQRAISDHTQSLSKGKSGTFEERVMMDQSKGVINTDAYIIQIGMYAKHLKNWLDFFPLSQILIINGEELVTNPADVMFKVQEFLNLERVINENYFFFNETKGFPCLKRDPAEVVPKCLDSSKGRQHPPVNPSVITSLENFFRPYNNQFFKLAKMTFPWK